ncbi:MAG TPA: YafY family protein [Opitutaceae bacterium]|nr:YafY family protein [Opitutaceae bacterium]
MNRTDRLVAMVMYLQGRRVVRAEDMAAHFEVSLRTIYRDIAALGESGVPIIGEPGVGYSILKTYHLPPVMLTAEEASALFMGAELAKQFSDGSMTSPLESGVMKVRAILPRDRQDYIDQLNRKTVIFGTPSFRHSEAQHREWLLPLQEAAVRRKAVELRYRARMQESDTNRTVEPLGVVFYAGIWFLVAWCRLRDRLRHFRLDRIREIKVTAETFQARPDFDLASHVQAFSAPEQMVPVKVRFSEKVVERARREGSVSMTAEVRTPLGIEIAMSAYSIDWMASWLISFGGEAEALEPEGLRQAVRDLAERVFQKHAGVDQTEPQLA